jgi:hypothetical protein
MDDIRTRDIKWHFKTKKICQIPKEGLEFALVSPDYKQVHQLVWCKDFVQDAIHGYLNKSHIVIYGFVYDPVNSPPISLDKTRIIVANWKDKELGEKVLSRALPLIHSIESRLKLDLTEISKCGKCPPIYGRSGVWLLEGDKKWMIAPPMISLYTMLIRIGMVHDPKDTLEDTIQKIESGKTAPYFSQGGASDAYQVKEGKKGIQFILRHGVTKVFGKSMKQNYPPLSFDSKFNIYCVHNKCGIVGFSTKQTKDYFPKWHKLEEETK